MGGIVNRAGAALLGATLAGAAPTAAPAAQSPAPQTEPAAHYTNFKDFAQVNGIRLLDPKASGGLALNLSRDPKDVLMAAVAGAASNLPSSSIALNQTTGTATVVLGQQQAENKGTIDYFVFDSRKSEMRLFSSKVTINPDGTASMDMTGENRHPYGSTVDKTGYDEQQGFDQLSINFNQRSDRNDLVQGVFASYARQKGLPLGGVTALAGQFAVGQDGKIATTTSCTPLSDHFGLCATGIYNGNNGTYDYKLQAISINGAPVKAASAVPERAMRPDLYEQDTYGKYMNAAPGIKTYAPKIN